MLYQYRRPFLKDLWFVLALTLGWGLYYISLRGAVCVHPPLCPETIAYATWAFFSSVISILSLYWLNFFRPFKGFKFIPDFISVWFIIPLAGLLSKPFITLMFQTDFVRSREILVVSFFPALLAVLLEGFNFWSKQHSNVKSNVYLALTPGEKERFMESIYLRGWEKHYRYLSHEELTGALATGGRVDYIVISRVATKNFISHQNILQAHMHGVCILDYRTLLNQMRGHISLNDTDIWTFLAGAPRQGAFDGTYRKLKFYLEPIVAAVMLILLLPLFLVVGLIIKLSSAGPVFYSQKRVGYLGTEFYLIKFRSMRIDAESQGVQWASKTDNRVTSIGRMLRKTRLDELPQLWNVFKGEISFMGPRPERPEFYEIIEKQVPHFKLRLLVRPGITGWAQLLGGYAASIEESERKLEFDLYYMQYLSPRMDIIILGRTILTLLKGNSGQ